MMTHHNRKLASACVITLTLLGLIDLADAFSWRRDSSVISSAPADRFGLERKSAPQILLTTSRLSATYEVALNELQQLESEPLCHRSAARLLVNNCHLLEGKDEATILTDSGHKIRDFVDAYAASLAICDLERGSFLIPEECTNFREPALVQLPVRDHAHLHVTSTQINGCLSALGSSDAAWNTWISYRHKTLRFCEAARADNENAERIFLFQRLTKIMSKLADGVEQRIEETMADLGSKAQRASAHLDQLAPQVDQLKTGIHKAEELITIQLAEALKRSSDAVNSGVDTAADLQKMIELMMMNVHATTAEVASAHEVSVQLVTRRAESELATVMTAIVAAVASASSLQNQIVSRISSTTVEDLLSLVQDMSRLQASELEYRQGHLEQVSKLFGMILTRPDACRNKGMQRLIDMTGNLFDKYDDHTQLLNHAHNRSAEILNIMEDTAASAGKLGDSLAERSSVTSKWPYILCPAASVLMGSYGLPPSALRNIALMALGEVAALAVSTMQSFSLESMSGSIGRWRRGIPSSAKGGSPTGVELN